MSSNSTNFSNPFEPPPAPHITTYTAQQIATLQSRLDKQLGPEYISSRPGAGGQKVQYLAAEKSINLANEVFGFNGWSSQIRDIQVDFADEFPNGKVSVGLSVIVRVTLKDGAFHEVCFRVSSCWEDCVSCGNSLTDILDHAGHWLWAD